MPLPEDEVKKPGETLAADIPPNFEQVTGKKPEGFKPTAGTPQAAPATPAPGTLPPLTPPAAAPAEERTPLPPNFAAVVARPLTTDESIMSEQVRHTRATAALQTEPAPDLELGDEVARSLGRGAVRLLQFFPQTLKMIGADLLRSKTVEDLLNPVLNRMDELAQSKGLREGARAQGTPIDLDQIMNDPGKVLTQIGENATNGFWWASKLPEQAGTIFTMWGGGIIARIIGGGAKLVGIARAGQALGTAEGLATATAALNKLNRLSKIGTYGAAIAMEAGEAEQGLRQWELSHPDVSWGKRVLALGISGAAGAFEAMSFERVFNKLGKNFPAKVLDSIITEGSTEGIQTVIENTAKKLGYDWDQKLTEGIVEAIMIGGVMGGGMGGGAHAVERYREGLRTRIEQANAEQYEWDTSQAYRRGAHRATTGAAIFPGTEEAMQDEEALRGMGKVEEVQDHKARDTGLGDTGPMEPGGESVTREINKDRTPPPEAGEAPPGGPEVSPQGPQGPQAPPTMGPEGVAPEVSTETTAPTGDLGSIRDQAINSVWSYDRLTPAEVQSFQDSIGQAGTQEDIESIRRQAEMTSKYRQATAAGTAFEGGPQETPPEQAGPVSGETPPPTEGGPAPGGATITQEVGERPGAKPEEKQPETPPDHHAVIDGMNIDEEHKGAYHQLIDSTDDPETKAGFINLARIVETGSDNGEIEEAANWIVDRRKAGATDEAILGELEKGGWTRDTAKAMLHITQEQAPEGFQPEPEKGAPIPGAEAGAGKTGEKAPKEEKPGPGPGPEAAPGAPTEADWEHVTNADDQQHADRLIKKLGANIKNKEYRARKNEKGKWVVERRHVAGEAAGPAAEGAVPKGTPTEEEWQPVAHDMPAGYYDEKGAKKTAEDLNRGKAGTGHDFRARKDEGGNWQIERRKLTPEEQTAKAQKLKEEKTGAGVPETTPKAEAGKTGEKAPKEEKPGPGPEAAPKEGETGEKEAEGEQVEDVAASVKLAKEYEKLLAQAVFKHDKPLEKATVIAKAKEHLKIEHKELWRYRKLMEEALELAVVNQARAIILSNDNAEVSDEETLAQLTKLYNYTPVLRARDSESVLAQAYSTPAPLAFLMSRAAGVMQNTSLYEPTAGNGMLTIGADPKNVHVNEILKDRLEHLKSQGFGTVTNFDATEQAAKAKSADVVMMNPPFGAINKQTFDGFDVRKKEHLIAMRALQAMADDGNAAIIIGGHTFADNMGKPKQFLTEADRLFLNYLYSRYNVVSHINIDGKVYERMGTKFPIRLLIIHGRKAEVAGMAPASPDQINHAMTFEQVYDLLKEVIANAEGEKAPVGAGVAGEQPQGEGGAERPGGTGKGAGRPGMGGAVGPESAGPGEGGESAGPGPGATVGGTGGGTGAGPEAQGPAGPAEEGGAGALGPVAPGARGGPEGEAGAAGEVPPGGGPGAKPGGKAGGTETGGAQRPGERGGRPKPGDEGKGPVGGEKKGPEAEKEAEWPKTPEDHKVAAILKEFLPWWKRSGWENEGFDSPLKWLKSLTAENKKRVQEYILKYVVQGQAWEGEAPIGGAAGKGKRKGKGQTDFTDEERDFARRVYEEAEKAFGGQPDWEEMKRKYQEAADQRAETENKEEEAERIRQAQEQETELQDTYQPTSSQSDRLGTVAPKNMRDAMQTAIQRFEADMGPVDTYVLKKLQYSSYEALYKCLAAEQIEVVALTIREIERGQALIMGWQTGVGKGRCCAAIMRYARLEGKKPIFVTAKANLFQDLYRDLMGIDSADFRPLLIGNPEESLIVDPDTEKPIYRIGAEMKRAQQAAYVNRAIPEGFDGVFTTYSQYQNDMRQVVSPSGAVRVTGGPKHHFLEAAARNNIVILDESHEAAGSDSGKAVTRQTRGMSNRYAFFSQILRGSQGVMYSSATFAKRSGAMPLYFRTAISNSGLPMDQLINRVNFLGVPGQEWLSQQLTLEGQMSRLESSYKGIVVEPRVDETNKLRDAERVDKVTAHLRNIIDLDELKRRTILPNLRNFLAGQWGGALAPGQSLRNMVDSANFTSIVHNAISQMMYSMRAGATADMAVELMTKRVWTHADGETSTFPNGQKPFVAVFNTMDSLIKDMVAGGIIKVGDEFDPDFRAVLLKNLESLRYVRIKPPGSSVSTRVKLDDNQLMTFAPEFYNRFMAMKKTIMEADDLGDLSATPLDLIKREIKIRSEARFKEMATEDLALAALADTDPEGFKAAVKEQFGDEVEDVAAYAANLKAAAANLAKKVVNVGEITGRQYEILEDEKGTKRLQERKGGSKNSRNAIIRGYNNGGLDAVLVNTAGFTGMSAHASKEFKDQTPRAMVVSQLPPDINMVMQGMGRINRTGQVVPPAYYFVSSALPAETRPLMVLTKKLRTLSANVSANADTWLNLDVQDTMNNFGAQNAKNCSGWAQR